MGTRHPLAAMWLHGNTWREDAVVGLRGAGSWPRGPDASLLFGQVCAWTCGLFPFHVYVSDSLRTLSLTREHS